PASLLAASSPPKPAPTMTTCGGSFETSSIRECSSKRPTLNGQHPIGKQLSATQLALSFAPYAESNRTQQNQESREKTIQDHCAWQSSALSIVAASFALRQERKTQKAPGQGGACSRNGRRTDQSK